MILCSTWWSTRSWCLEDVTSIQCRLKNTSLQHWTFIWISSTYSCLFCQSWALHEATDASCTEFICVVICGCDLRLLCLRSHFLCTMWVKKSPLWFSDIFSNGWEFLIKFLHTYYVFLSTLDYKFLFNYLQLWRSYVILSKITHRIFYIPLELNF